MTGRLGFVDRMLFFCFFSDLVSNKHSQNSFAKKWREMLIQRRFCGNSHFTLYVGFNHRWFKDGWHFIPQKAQQADLRGLVFQMDGTTIAPESPSVLWWGMTKTWSQKSWEKNTRKWRFISGTFLPEANESRPWKSIGWKSVIVLLVFFCLFGGAFAVSFWGGYIFLFNHFLFKGLQSVQWSPF